MIKLLLTGILGILCLVVVGALVWWLWPLLMYLLNTAWNVFVGLMVIFGVMAILGVHKK